MISDTADSVNPDNNILCRVAVHAQHVVTLTVGRLPGGVGLLPWAVGRVPKDLYHVLLVREPVDFSRLACKWIPPRDCALASLDG